MPEATLPADWYSGLRELRQGNRRALYGLLAVLPEMPESFVDIGCGDGTLVEIMSCLLRVNDVMGVDFYHTSPLVHAADLSQPVELGRRFDLVTSWEIAEHIVPEAADVLCATIAGHVGRWLVFTAAQPGQVGFHHVNCQPPEYWRKKFVDLGLDYSASLSEAVRSVWDQIAAYEWLRRNVQVFVSRVKRP